MDFFKRDPGLPCSGAPERETTLKTRTEPLDHEINVGKCQRHD